VSVLWVLVTGPGGGVMGPAMHGAVQTIALDRSATPRFIGFSIACLRISMAS